MARRAAPKTEALSIRIDPRLRFGLELMARQQRRSVTGVVEWAIDVALNSEPAAEVWGREPVSFAELLRVVWHPNEAERLVNLAQNFPGLLTYEESRMWEVINRSPDFWDDPDSPHRSVQRDVLFDQWEKVAPLIAKAAERPVLKGLTSKELDEAGVIAIPF